MTNYYLVVRDRLGDYKGVLNNFAELSYSRAENDKGMLDVILFPDADMSLFQDDSLIEVHRSTGGFATYIEDVYLITMTTKAYSGNKILINIHGENGNGILGRRIIPYATGTDYSDKEDLADDVMKDIVTENFLQDSVNQEDTTRKITDYLTVTGKSSSSIIVCKQVSMMNVLAALQDIANEVKQTEVEVGSNAYLAFNMVYLGLNKFEFNTYTEMLGENHTMGTNEPLIFAPEIGNFIDAELTYNFIDERNYVYCGGQGIGSEREVIEDKVISRSTVSPFSRREIFVDGRETDDVNVLASMAKSELYTYRARIELTGTLLDSPSVLYGVHYHFGDMVTIKFDDIYIDVHIDKISITFQNGNEKLDIKVTGTFLGYD